MKRQWRFLLVCLTFLTVLGCGGSNTLPTLTPTFTPEPTATKKATSNDATPVNDKTSEPKPTEEADPGGTSEPPSSTPSVDRQTRMLLLRSTVQILALVKKSGRLQPMWTGSGTILSEDGMILTNAHVVSDPDPDYQPDALGVAITVRSDELPELKYLAEVRAIDEDMDLAVIQIVSDLSGNPVDPESLGLNYVSIGDSDELELGDLLQILGYPGIGGETITFTEGVVSGFTREPGVDGRAYIKTDATIAGGNSGGLAANLGGFIIGVPTQVGYGGAERFADCRYLADTNNDGRIDESDNCIPVGGFINAIRPVNLARPLVEAARLGIAVPTSPNRPGTVTGEPQFSNLLFAPDVNEQDLPSRVVRQLPSGATHLYACWEYSGMSEDLSWEARWYRDDDYLDDVSWQESPWTGDESGSWWVSVYNEEGLTEGTYRVELSIDGELMVAGEIPVGGEEVVGPTMTDLIFAADVTEDGKPVDATYLLPSGISQVYAFFDYTDMEDGLSWSRVWYFEGEQIAARDAVWDGGVSGAGWIGLSARSPLAPGSYRLELYVEGAMLAAANFAVAGTQAEDAFGPITFASGVDSEGDPVDPGRSFPTGATELRYFVDYTGMQNGLDFTAQWYFDGEELFSVDYTWDLGEEGTFTDNIYRKNGDPLWDGEYMLELYIEGELVQSAAATIGGGEAPPPTPEAQDGLVIMGYVLDADTGRGIPGAVYIVLNPGISVDDWSGDEDEVYTAAQTDDDGYFELPDALERGESYSIIVWADGYRPVAGDDIEVSEDEVSPVEVEIELQKE